MDLPVNNLRELLLAESSVAALIGSSGYITNAPAGSGLPRIVIHQMGSDEQNDLLESGDARQVEIDVDCEGATAQDAYTLARAVRVFLKDFRGATPNSGPTFEECNIDDEHEKKVEKTTQPNQTRQYAVTVPVSILYRP